MNKATTTRTTLFASAVMALLTISIDAHAMPSERVEAPYASAWYSTLWSWLGGEALGCRRCHCTRCHD